MLWASAPVPVSADGPTPTVSVSAPEAVSEPDRPTVVSSVPEAVSSTTSIGPMTTRKPPEFAAEGEMVAVLVPVDPLADNAT